jgi:hypothetical protein
MPNFLPALAKTLHDRWNIPLTLPKSTYPPAAVILAFSPTNQYPDRTKMRNTFFIRFMIF